MATILTKKSDTSSAVPLAGDLTNSTGGAELAVNTADKRLFVKNSGGTVVEVGTNPSSITTGTANATTVDTTNLEVTNIKAKDGTAAASIADSTGKITVSTELAVDNLNLSGNTLSSTNSNGAINLTPNGTGQVTVTNDALVSGLTVGKGAGAVSTNTAVGASALGSNTTGSYNAALGSGAGQANTTGIQSTFVGGLAGGQNTTGSITAIGYASLYGNTTGTNNVAVGHNNGTGIVAALQTNTTGSQNTALGLGSLGLNTTGSNNTAMGLQSLYSNTTASNNTAVGYQAGYSNTTGQENVFIGYKAGYTSNSSGPYGNTPANVAIGPYAGYSLTTGYGNTFVGGYTAGTVAACGYLVTTGSKNTIIGAYNGNQGGLDIRTASNYIVLSDGDGNPRGLFDSDGNWFVGKVADTAGAVGWVNKSNGTGSATFTLSGTNEIFVWNNTATNGTAIIDFRSANTSKGRISWDNTNTTYNTSSDYRLKNTIAPMTGALAKVAQLKPVTYKWNVDGSDGEGFIAHELAEVCPHAVTGEKDAVNEDGSIKPQGIDTSFLVATLTAAIQEQQAIIESLKARLDAANL